MFDDSWLEDQQALRSADFGLRRLAEAGARLRREIGEAEEPLLQIGQLDRPRAVIAAGSEARSWTAKPHSVGQRANRARILASTSAWTMRRSGLPGRNSSVFMDATINPASLFLL